MNEFSSRLGCLATLVEVAQQANVVEGRVRVQKTLYLLKRLGVRELDGVDFIYHHYGPFSWTVAETLANAVNENVLVEAVDSMEQDKRRYRYTPGNGAAEYAADLVPASRAIVHAVVERTRSEQWRTLELAATIDYLEHTGGFSREAAQERALLLKPLCASYTLPALAVLKDLNLA